MNEGNMGLISRGALVVMLIAACVCPLSAADAPKIGAARFYPQTEIVTGGAANGVVVFSGTESEAARAGERLSQGLQQKYGMPFPKVSDDLICQERLGPVGDEYRQKNLIAVGNL